MKFLEFINYQIDSLLLEIKTSFKWDEFNKLTNLEQQVQYAKENLRELGAGSSRIVFLLSNRYVLKLALPSAKQKGISQNKSEVEVYTHPQAKKVVAAVYSHHPNYNWIVSEIARPMKNPDEFSKLTGIPWETFDSYVRNYKNIEQVVEEDLEEYQNAVNAFTKRLNMAKQQGNEKAVQTLSKKISNAQKNIEKTKNVINNPVLNGAIALIKDIGVMPGDIREWDHWGKTADGRVVLIDYGFTRDIADLYSASG